MPAPPPDLSTNPLSLRGRVSYNDVTFPANSSIDFRTRFQEDSAGRTIIACIYTITITCWIDADAMSTPDKYSTDTMMQALRQNLSTDGGELHLDGIGWGAFGLGTTYGGVNVGQIGSDPMQPARDILWGPKPKILQFKRLGGSTSAKLTWQVEIALPECDNAQYAFALMEFCFGIQTTIDASGYSRQTIKGHWRIPQTRNDLSRELTDSADSTEYREAVVASFPCPDKFRPLTATFDLSEDKCQMDFTLVYTEMPLNILPPGVIEARVSHEVENPKVFGSPRWEATISATYEMAKDVDGFAAYTYFLNLLQDRLNTAKTFATDEQGKQGTVLWTKLRVSEDNIYGKQTMSISASYFFLVSFDNFPSASALFTPSTDSDYNAWVASMKNTLFVPGARGYANLDFLPQSDTILDLCNNPPTSPSVLTTSPAPTGAVGEQLNNSYPDPEASWIFYDNKIKLHKLEEACEVKALPQTGGGGGGSGGSSGYLPSDAANPVPLRPPNQDDAGNRSQLDSTRDGTGVILDQYPYGGQPTSSIQYRAAPTISVVLEGEAIRAGYTIDPPQITTAGGAPLKPNDDENSYFEWSVIDSWFGIPIIYARWRVRYLMTQFPNASLGMPPNPLDQRNPNN